MMKKLLMLAGILVSAFGGYSQVIPPPENLPRIKMMLYTTDFVEVLPDPSLCGNKVYTSANEVTMVEDRDFVYLQGLFGNPDLFDNDPAIRNAWFVARKVENGIEFVQGQKVKEGFYLHTGLLYSTRWSCDIDVEYGTNPGKMYPISGNPKARRMYYENDSVTGQRILRTEAPCPKDTSVYLYTDSIFEGYVPIPVSAIWLSSNPEGRFYYERIYNEARHQITQDFPEKHILLAPILRPISPAAVKPGDD